LSRRDADHAVEPKIASAEGLLAAAAANKPAGDDSLTQARSEAQVVEASRGQANVSSVRRSATPR
jgi:hypothetical protein